MSARVDYGDLDLTTTAGQQQFRKRVEAAMARMCTYNDPTEPSAGEIRRECISLSRKSADRQVELTLEKAGKSEAQSLASRD